MRISFRREALANYMVIENVDGFSPSEFGVKMLEYNLILSLLRFDYEYMDGKVNFLYDISSKQSMPAVFETQKVTYETLAGFVRSLNEALAVLDEYLLDADNIMLKKECIFMDLKSGKYRYCYNPYYNGDIRLEAGIIFDELLNMIDYTDSRAVQLAYDLNRECRRENFTFNALAQLLEAEEDTPEDTADPHDSYARCDIENNSGPNPGEIYTFGTDDFPVPADITKTDPPGFFQKLSSYFKGKSVYDIAEDIDSGQIRAKIKESAPVLTESENKKLKKKKASEKAACKRTEKSDRSLCTHKSGKDNSGAPYSPRPDDDIFFEEIELGLAQAEEEGLWETTILNAPAPERRKLVGINRQQGQIIEIEGYPFTIGKMKEKVNFAATSPAVSRMHCRIYEKADRPDEYLFEDLNSKNGSFINSLRLNPYSKAALHPGDIIKIADEEYAFR